MASQPLGVKLRCSSWGQVAGIYERDLRRGSLFLGTATPIPLGRELRIDLVLPSGTVASIEGRVAHAVPSSDRGPGVIIVLTKIPPSTLYLIESALEAAAAQPAADDAGLVEEPWAAAAEQELIAALEAEVRGLRAMNPFQVLGVPYDAEDQSVRLAFVELSKRYHPDRFARFESERGRALASEVFMAVRDAYRRIGDPRGRALVRAQIGNRTTRRDATPIFGVPVARVSTPVQGVRLPPSGERDPAAPIAPIEPERSGQPHAAPSRPQPPRAPAHDARARPGAGAPTTSAASRTESIVTFHRSELPTGLNAEDLFSDLGEPPRTSRGSEPVRLDGPPAARAASELLDAGRYEEALAAYDGELRANPTDRSARAGRELAFGLKLAAAGDRDRAIQHLEAALEIEPLSERTAHELNRIRRAVTESRKGLLSKLLGRTK
jgi:tetratricopeptide (TPR) repeat protein